MLHTIYQTTHIDSGRIYIGAHSTENPLDKYLGSGKFLKRAVKKYGRKAFSKKVLFIFKTSEEMYEKEKELVTSEFVEREDNFNLIPGGRERAGIFEKERSSGWKTFWIFKEGEKDKKIPTTELQTWIEKGWRKGRGSAFKENISGGKEGETSISCPDCGKTYSLMGIRTHQWRTHGDGKGFISNPSGPENIPWNKGLTSETSERVQRNAEAISNSTKGKPRPTRSRPLRTPEIERYIRTCISDTYKPPKRGVKLTWEDIRILRELFSTGVASQTELSVFFNVSRMTVNLIIRQKTWVES